MLKNFLRSVYRRVWVLPRIQKIYKELTIAETFQRIYSTKSWGDNDKPFSSGSGTYGPVALHYCEFILRFIREHGVRTIVDLGCGDYAIGSRIVQASDVIYTGIDVVPELIEYHKNSVANPRARFQCADITSDIPPSADLCLVRQVLQHLSNQEIAKALTNLRGYKYVLISEDVPVRPRVFNRDKPHGPDIRAYYGSGVWVERSPFDMAVSQIWEIPLAENSLLRTVLLTRTPEPTSENAVSLCGEPNVSPDI